MHPTTHHSSHRISQGVRQAVCSVAHIVHRQQIVSIAIALALVIGLLGQVLAPAGVASAAPALQAGGTWTPTAGSSNIDGYTATRMLDGRVLIVGGGFNGTRSAQIYDPATGTMSSAASTIYPHGYHVAALLNDGRVLVAGSGNSIWADHGRVEIYNPSTNTWTETASIEPRSMAAAVTLADGRVLVAGGLFSYNSTRVDIYNPATGTWTYAGSLNNYRYGPAITRLADGRVLVSGGKRSIQNWMNDPWNTAEIYNPATNSWTLTPNMSQGRTGHTSTLLANGKVLVVGYANSQVYDPATNSWSAPVSLKKARSSHGAVLLNNGRVLVAGGFNNSAEIYDPATNSWSLTASMNATHNYTTLTLLNNGKVFATGGPHELFTPQP